jgi:hypothetical protein
MNCVLRGSEVSVLRLRSTWTLGGPDVDVKVMLGNVQSAYREKIPARKAIYAHAQDFSAGDVLLLAILKAFIPQPLNKQRTIGFHVF